MCIYVCVYLCMHVCGNGRKGGSGLKEKGGETGDGVEVNW